MSRGAVKYQPFNALEGHKEALRQKEIEMGYVDKPLLSEDDCIRINDILIEVINENLIAEFYIFKKNRISTVNSKVLKVLNGYLYLEEDVILITDIVDIKI